jgi:VCBS repeat-containing protein
MIMVAANTLFVGADGFDTIQAAVNAASDGDTIIVSAGTYIEQVIVAGFVNLTIRAADGAQVTIQAPADVVETARSASDREIHAVFTVVNSTNVTLDNIDIDGAGRGTTVDEGGGAGIANFYGTYYRNASGSLLGVDVTGVRDPYPGGTTAGGEPLVDGVQRGIGVVVDNDSLLAFTMTGGSISDFQKNGALFSRADLNITGVTITGGGAQTIIAQNGITVTRSTGTISGNTITGIGYAGPAEAYSGGILAPSNTNLDITGNTVTGSNIDNPNAKVVGIWLYQSSVLNSGGEVSGNMISHTDVGIAVDDGVSPDPVLIENNSVTDPDLSDPYSAGLRFEPTATFVTPFDVDGTQIADRIRGGAGADTLSGLGDNDTIDGNDGADTLDGGDGNDVLTGGAGDDVIIGGSNGDTLYGSEGNDIFRYDFVTDSDIVEADGIQDFNPGDRIDITNIDANTLIDGDQAFEFIGANAFSGKAGELRFKNLGGTIWEVQGDTDGNGDTDFRVVVIKASGDPIAQSDFIDIVNAPAVADDDTNSTTEAAAVDGDVGMNDYDNEADGFSVIAVNGDSTKVGQPITLASGALLTLNDDGNYTYDPNGVFDSLISAEKARATGGANATATDTFTYTITGGDTATVTVTINGLDSPEDVIRGSANADTITGIAGASEVIDLSQGGADTVSAGDGDDLIFYGSEFTPDDRNDGGSGTDTLSLLGSYDLTFDADDLVGIEKLQLLAGNSTDSAGAAASYNLTTVDGTVGAEGLFITATSLRENEALNFNGTAETDGAFNIRSGAGDDILAAGAKADRLNGGSGDDQLFGLAGNDTLIGGLGTDVLRGGGGKDIFRFESADDSSAVDGEEDRIVDFQRGFDKIDLSAIDADETARGNQEFTFVGDAGFSSKAGELRSSAIGEGRWLVQGDTDGDGAADFAILVTVNNAQPLTATDFIV